MKPRIDEKKLDEKDAGYAGNSAYIGFWANAALKRNIVIIAMAIAAFAIFISLTISYKFIFLLFNILIIYIFLVDLVIWLDGAWEEKKPPLPKKWPDVSIIIPTYNSIGTVLDAIKACKQLEYPKPVEIIVVDDGSTDGSYEKLKSIDGIVLVRKEKNEGKAAALNTGLKIAKGEIICTVDSDSYPQKYCLMKAIPHFYSEDKVGSVVLFICAHKPKNILQRVQEIEYLVSFGFFYKTISSIDGLYVAPGPMSLYKKEVFEELGGFDEKNITEDMEIALRMQKHGWKIRACHESIVFTEVPATLHALFRQRVRWYRGGIINILKYIDMLLNPRYRSFGLFVLPTVLGSGFFSALIMLWLISTYIKTMFNWSIPLIEQPSAISSAAFSLFTPDILLVDSVIIFGFIGLIIWGYFLYKSFQLVHQKIEFRHLVPLAILVGIYPLFIGVTFLASYAAELSARKYKW